MSLRDYFAGKLGRASIRINIIFYSLVVCAAGAGTLLPLHWLAGVILIGMGVTGLTVLLIWWQLNPPQAPLPPGPFDQQLAELREHLRVHPGTLLMVLWVARTEPGPVMDGSQMRSRLLVDSNQMPTEGAVAALINAADLVVDAADEHRRRQARMN